MSMKSCHNGPNLVIDREGLQVYGASLYEAEDNYYNYDLIISLGIYCKPNKEKGIAKSRIKSVGLERVIEKFIYQPEHLVLDWQDYGVPFLSKEFWLELVRVLKKKGRDRSRHNNGNGKYKVMLHCQGGHGRTGTALAILAGLVYGSEEGWNERIVKKIREKHCSHSVENDSQLEYVEKITGVDCSKEKGSKIYSNSSIISTSGYLPTSVTSTKLTSLAPEVCRDCLKKYENVKEAIECERKHAVIKYEIRDEIRKNKEAKAKESKKDDSDDYFKNRAKWRKEYTS